MSIKKGDKGDAVRDLQIALMELGYALPRWGADGDLGEETLVALGELFTKQGRIVDDTPAEVSDIEEKFVYSLRDLLRKKQARTPTNFVDRRAFASKRHDYGPRPWNKVTGICLHQTACDLGEKDERYNTIGCHFVVCKSGKVLQIHDMDRLIVHGNGWNAQTVGIEIDGLFAGIHGDVNTVWNDPSTAVRETGSTPTEEAIKACKQLLRYICGEVTRRGGEMKVLVAHRQASENRRNDPGSYIWQRVAIPMQSELGLHDGGPGFKIGTGYPIPEAWNPAYKGVKY